MERETYLQRLKQIEDDAQKAKQALYIEYGLSQAIFKMGDVIRDNRWAFQIDKITVSKMFGDPEPVYSGFELKKDLTPKKNMKRVSIYGNSAELIKSAEPKEETINK